MGARAARDGGEFGADRDHDRHRPFQEGQRRLRPPFGDLCLQAVAAALRSALARPGDLLARFGGEEFVALLPSTNAEGAAVVSARMLAAVAAIAILHPGETVTLTCSIVVHTADTLGSLDPMAAISNADQALYQAKRSGRNRVVVFEAIV